MEEFNYYKCLVFEELNNSTESSLNNSSSINFFYATNVAGFGGVSGMLITLLIHEVLNNKFRSSLSSPLKSKRNPRITKKTALRAIALLFLVFFLPLISVCLLVALCFKLVCSILIKRRDKYFADFLDSFDVFWSLEDDTASSVINVVGFIECNSSRSILDNIKAKLNTVFSNGAAEKLFYRRNEKYGFYYWRRSNSVDIEEYVQMVQLPENAHLHNIENLETFMTDISNQSLPYDDQGLFKILITQQRVGNHDAVNGDYGIIFRIHHSVGDGVALIEFLCKTLADNHDIPVTFFIPKSLHAKNARTPNNLMCMINRLWQIPLCLVDGILRKPDDNTLHGPILLKREIFKWTKSDEDLLVMVKQIKESIDSMKFSDILITALSRGLRNFFTKTQTSIPEELAVVIPVRFPKTLTTDSDLKLENDFSVTILDLPVKTTNIEEIKNRCDAIRNSADPLTNYYLLKLLNSVLPKHILKPLLNSSQASMVFSNMPGPENLSICGGNILKKLIFFVPHKGNTGLGVTALCYNGILSLGASADVALVSRSEDLALILDGMVEEIKRLHKECMY